MPDELHELSALYALDVLDAEQRAQFEEHLAGCERCRSELAGLRDDASGLVFVEGPAPPGVLRRRVVFATRSEPQNVVAPPPRGSRGVAIAAGIAVAACLVAVGLGVWAASLHHSLAQERSATSILDDPLARRLSLSDVPGLLVVAPSGDAVLTVSLPSPPADKIYESWVVGRGARAAGTFSGGLVKLTRAVHRGNEVMVTLEPSGGVDAPTGLPILHVRT
jgi:hypothetical protein